MPRLFMSNNDVINAGHNNWLFAPGTDMDRALDHLSHIPGRISLWKMQCYNLYLF
jgi:hypothetical protein